MSSGGRSCLAPVWWEEGSGSRGCHGVSAPDGGVCLGNPALSLLFRWRGALGLAPASPADPGLFLGCSHAPRLPAEVSLETRLADVLPPLTQLGAGEFPFPSPCMARGSCFFPQNSVGQLLSLGPACEEPAVGMECRARPGRALLPLPWVSRAPRPLPVSQGGQEEPSSSGGAASAASSLQTPDSFSISPQLPAPLSPMPLSLEVAATAHPASHPLGAHQARVGVPVGSAGKGDIPPSLASGAARARV